MLVNNIFDVTWKKPIFLITPDDAFKTIQWFLGSIVNKMQSFITETKHINKNVTTNLTIKLKCKNYIII